MTESTPRDPFEQRIAGMVRTYTDPAAVPVDHLSTARAAMTAPAGRRAGLGRASLPAVDRRLFPLLAAAGLVFILVALALAGGSKPKPPPLDLTSRLVFVRDGDMFVSAVDGSGATMIRDGGADDTSLGYLTAVWSPDARSIAAVRDVGGPVLTTAIDILEPDGAVRRTIDTGRGGTPSVSWSPDSTRLAIATGPADLQRDATEPVPAKVRLTIEALDGGSSGIDLPPDAEWLTSAQPEIWTFPDIGVRWSPDGRWIAVAWSDPWGRYHMVAADGSGVLATKPTPANQCRSSRDFIDWFPDGRRLATIGGWASVADLCVESVGRDGRPNAPAEIVDTTPADEPDKPHTKFIVPAVSPDGGRIAISTFIDEIDGGRHRTALRVYDLESGLATDVASGVEKLSFEASGQADVTTVLEGEPVWMGGVAWTGDGKQLLYLNPEPGDSPMTWTIRAVDAAGGSPSVAVVHGVRSFDIGYAH